MAELNFNTIEGQEVERELLVLCLNVGTSSAQEWIPLGCGVADSSAGYDWQKNTEKDILGHTHTTLKKPIITQTFDGWPMRNGDKAQKFLWDKAIKDQDAMAMANLDVLLIHKYAGQNPTGMFAERYPQSAIEWTGLGGQGGGRIEMPVNVTFGGERTTGTASITDGEIAYTAGK